MVKKKMSYASIYAQTAKKEAPTMLQEKSLEQGKGFSMDLSDKREAIFKALFDEARGEIEKVYLPGTMAYLKAHHSKLYNEALLAEMRLEHLWLTMRKGGDTLKKFKATLKEWKEIHLKAVELYKGELKQKGP